MHTSHRHFWVYVSSKVASAYLERDLSFIPAAPSLSSFDFSLELWSSAALRALSSGSYEIFEHCSGSLLTPSEFSNRAPAPVKMGARGLRIRSLYICKRVHFRRALAAKVRKYTPSCDLQIICRFDHRGVRGCCFINFTLRSHRSGDCVYNSW